MIRPEPFRDAAADGASLTIGELFRLHGRVTWPAWVMVLGLLSTLPLTGVGTLLSLPLLALAAHTRRAGGRAPGADGSRLHQRLLGHELGQTWSRRCLKALAALYEQAGRVLARRWVGWRHPRTFGLWRVWIALMALLILLPLPFGNILPGAALMLLGLGWSWKDGVALGLSALVGVLAIGYGALSVGVIAAVLRTSVEWGFRLLA